MPTKTEMWAITHKSGGILDGSVHHDQGKAIQAGTEKTGLTWGVMHNRGYRLVRVTVTPVEG